MTISLLEIHRGKVEKVRTWGFSVLLINGRSLLEVWKGRYTWWVELLFVRILEK